MRKSILSPCPDADGFDKTPLCAAICRANDIVSMGVATKVFLLSEYGASGPMDAEWTTPNMQKALSDRVQCSSGRIELVTNFLKYGASVRFCPSEALAVTVMAAWVSLHTYRTPRRAYAFCVTGLQYVGTVRVYVYLVGPITLRDAFIMAFKGVIGTKNIVDATMPGADDCLVTEAVLCIVALAENARVPTDVNSTLRAWLS